MYYSKKLDRRTIIALIAQHMTSLLSDQMSQVFLTYDVSTLVRLVTTGRGRPGSLIVVELWVVATVLRGKGRRGTWSGHSNGHAVVSVGRSFLAAGAAAARAWTTTTKVCGKIQAHLGQGGRFVGRRTGWCQFGRRGNCSRRRGGGVYNRVFAAAAG